MKVVNIYIWQRKEQDAHAKIDQPAIPAAQIAMKRGNSIEDTREDVEARGSELENIDKFCMELAYGKIPIC